MKIDQPPSPILDKESIHSLDLPVYATKLQPWAYPYFPLDGPNRLQQSLVHSHTMTKLEQEYLHLHYALGHIHPDRMQIMVQQGTLPKRYKRCRLPFCTSCAYGKATRKLWQLHTSTNINEAAKPQRPGECVSVNQLISPTSGFIAQMSG